MKKIIKILQRWFEHYGLVKIIAAFLILIICIVIDQKFRPIKLVEYIGIAAAIYLLITVVTFTIAGNVNSINDFINIKKE